MRYCRFQFAICKPGRIYEVIVSIALPFDREQVANGGATLQMKGRGGSPEPPLEDCESNPSQSPLPGCPGRYKSMA